MIQKLSRGRMSLLWLALASLLLATSGTGWRELTSSPAGTLVRVVVKGSDLIPLLGVIGWLGIVIAISALFANRMVIIALTLIEGVLGLFAFTAILQNIGSGHPQIGVTVKVNWLPAVLSMLWTLGSLAMALLTPLAARRWLPPRYRAAEQTVDRPIDIWRAQDGGFDPTQENSG